MISGTLIDGSYTTSLPSGIRCSPYMNPLSEVNTISVLSSSWTSPRTVTILVTARSTESSDSSCRWYASAISASVRESIGGRARIGAGLSPTSGSLYEGGLGSGSHAKRPSSRSAGIAVSG
jgi:hypothetical protein